MTNASLSSGVSRREPQESPAILVALSDHALVNLDAEWRDRNIGWKMDNIHLTSIAYADDICLLASNKKDLELMVKECIDIDGFLAAGLETGLDKTFWTSTTRSERHFER